MKFSVIKHFIRKKLIEKDETLLIDHTRKVRERSKKDER